MSKNSLILQAGGKDYTLVQSRLKEWLQSADIYEEYKNARKSENFSVVPQLIFSFLKISVHIPEEESSKWPWIDTVSMFNAACILNSPESKAPIINFSSDVQNLPWDYFGRQWYIWWNMFATAYGWTEEIIANLDIDDAISLYQEVQLQQQMEREFIWSTSQNAYSYNKSSQKSEYHAFPRPSWMLPIPEAPKKVKLLKSMLPMGVINPGSVPADMQVSNDA